MRGYISTPNNRNLFAYVHKEFSEGRHNAPCISLIVSLYSIGVLSIVTLYLNSQFVLDSAHLTVLCTPDMAELADGILDWRSS